MRTITCDICREMIEHEPLRVEVLDGEHPHNGSTMYKDLDVCCACASKMKLRCNEEFDELTKRIKR